MQVSAAKALAAQIATGMGSKIAAAEQPSPLVCDAVPATKVDASGTKSHGDRVSEGSPHEVVRCLDHSLTEFTSMGALPFDVLHAAHNTRRAA